MQTASLINELISLTAPFINRPDLIQGPGGNTSVKDECGNMIIKASGFRFNEINRDSGFSLVNSGNIKFYFENVNVHSKAECEKAYLEIVSQNILSKQDGNSYPKPSMETGFHAVLDKYVVHTHSVYTNLFNCNTNCFELVKQIQHILNLPVAYIPFVSPGFGLSYLICKEMQNANTSNKPVLFFLENHGIIAHGNNATEVKDLLFLLDTTISKLFFIDINKYPQTTLQKSELNFKPTHTFCTEILNKYDVSLDFFKQVLFPDQTVFFNENISFNASVLKKINIDAAKKITYDCNEREALSIHETLTAYLFLFDTLKSTNNKHRFINGDEIDYINNMDMEKHRKNLMHKS